MTECPVVRRRNYFILESSYEKYTEKRLFSFGLYLTQIILQRKETATGESYYNNLDRLLYLYLEET